MSTSVIAEIQSIQGTAYAVAVDGSKRTLQLGDQLFEGEVLETSEGGAVQLLLTDGSSYEVAGIPQLLLSAELLAVADSSRDENEVAATTFDALVEEGFGDTLEETVTQSDTVIDQALEDIFSEELEATAAGGAAGSSGAGSTFVQADRIDTGGGDDSVDGIGNVDLTADQDETAEQQEQGQAVATDDAFLINED
ncbi:MAG: retention module-containing protein, partial [Gammaproteobacteria bacterium]